MLLGDICTRRCGFCAVPKGRPEPIDWDEPRRVAEAVATLGLKHAVVTSVNRDDDNIGSARIFAETIREIRELTSGLPRRSADPGFSGAGRIVAHRARCAARRAQPQHRDRAAPLSRGSLGGALRAHAHAAGERQEVLARHGDQERRDGRAGRVDRTNWWKCSAIWARAASTFLRSDNICGRRKIICRLPVSTSLKSLPICGTRLCASVSAMLSRGRWCGPAITRTSMPMPLRRRGR